MSVITELFGKAVDLARKIESVPLQQTIIQLQQHVLELLAEKARTDEENRALKAQLRERDERERVRLALVFQDGVYRNRDGGDGAYCPRCLDADGKAVHLTVLGNDVLRCNNCKSNVIPTSRQRSVMDAITQESYPEPKVW